jgi:hypothetical protein
MFSDCVQSDSYLHYIYLLQMMVPGIRQGITFFTFPKSTVCPSDSISKNMKMNMECWWDDNERGGGEQISPCNT